MDHCVHLLATVAYAAASSVRGSVAQGENSSSRPGDLLHLPNAPGLSYAIASSSTADRQAGGSQPSSPAASSRCPRTTVTIEAPGRSIVGARPYSPGPSSVLLLSAGDPRPTPGLSKPSTASRLDLPCRLGAGASGAPERVALHEPRRRFRQPEK
jgi:hypothetical protein